MNNAEKQRKTIRVGKNRDLFNKIGDTKVTFHAKMGTIKDKNSKTKRSRRDKEEIAKTQGRSYQKKVLTIQTITMVPRPDILECEVKGSLGSITTKLLKVMEFQLRYFNL